jgi:hypothetical protein
VTLIEFLAQLPSPRTNRNGILATLYFMNRYQGVQDATVGQIRASLKQARYPAAGVANIAQSLSDAGHYVDTGGLGPGGARLWKLTDSGAAYVRELLGLPEAEPEIEYDVGSLTVLSAQITDENIRAYVDEAIQCLSVGALRAAIVFIWTAAIRTLHEYATAEGITKVNAALKKQDPKAREIKTADDFAYVKDRKFLDAAPDIGILDKGEKETLIEALNLRNRCGHPTKYRPKENKAKGFIEDVVGIVWD